MPNGVGLENSEVINGVQKENKKEEKHYTAAERKLQQKMADPDSQDGIDNFELTQQIQDRPIGELMMQLSQRKHSKMAEQLLQTEEDAGER